MQITMTGSPAPRRLALVMLALGLAACSGGGDTRGGGGGAHESTSARAHALVADGATLLDVRTPGEFRQGHVEGAVNVPIDELEGRLAEVPTDHPVVVYCLSGGRSASAARLLGERGYDVLDLGAMSNWSRGG